MGRRASTADADRSGAAPDTVDVRSDSGNDAVLPGPGSDEPADLASLLARLDPDSRVSITRISPAYAGGWLEDLVIPSGQESDLLALIRQAYGGGQFRVQAKTLNGNGKRVYARGTAVVTIAGPPLLNGRPYNPDGTLQQPTPPPQASAPMLLQQPAPQGSTLETLQAVAQVLAQQRGDGQGGGQSLEGVAEVVSALAQTARPQPQVDAFGQIDRTLTLLSKMRDAFGSNDGGGGDPGAFSDGDLMKLLLMNNTQQQQQPPPGMYWNGYQWVPQQYAPPQQQPQPQQAAPQAAAPTPAQPTSPPAAQSQGDDDEPYTVDEVLDGIDGLSDDEKMELLTKLGDVLPASMGQAIFSQMQSGQVIDLGGNSGET